MTNLNNQIISKISKIILQDGTNLKDIISNIIIKNNNVGFSIDVGNHLLDEMELIRQKAIEEISQIADIERVSIALTNNQKNKSTESKKTRHIIDNVKKIILVAAGKGGVGKSTIACLIAENLNLTGYSVGLVDADIYGPSIPHMFGINKTPEIIDKKMIPLKSRNIQINSIGFLTKDDAVAWRGPMASKAVFQLLSVTAWNNIDYLIIDMPPGTGDIHLSILENYYVDGAVIITTPQKISEIDVKKAIDLYKKFSIPILGIIENMSYLIHPQTREHIEVFSGNSAKYLSDKYAIPLIDKVPIIPQIATNCDQGQGLTNIVSLPLKYIEI